MVGSGIKKEMQRMGCATAPATDQWGITSGTSKHENILTAIFSNSALRQPAPREPTALARPFT